MDEDGFFLAGVDGCRGGWITVLCPRGRFDAAHIELKAHFAEVIDHVQRPAIIAVDMPIGLPDISSGGGRAAERELRAFLGPRRASAFSIPSRAAVFAYGEGYAAACEIARRDSQPPQAPSKQAFHIFPRIMEIDIILRRRPDAIARVYEVHPELAFALMNGAPLTEPKKRAGRCHPSGMEQRRALLLREGFDAAFLATPMPIRQGKIRADRDDFYDACATLWSAARIHKGCAKVFPARPEMDGCNLPVRISG